MTVPRPAATLRRSVARGFTVPLRSENRRYYLHFIVPLIRHAHLRLFARPFLLCLLAVRSARGGTPRGSIRPLTPFPRSRSM